MAIFLPVIIGAPLLLLSKRVGQVLDALPASWLIALQVYRVFVSVFLAGAHALSLRQLRRRSRAEAARR